MDDLKGKIALVTGSGSGIGAGIAQRLIETGAIVYVSDVDVDRGESVAERIGAARFIRLDVTRQDGWQQAMERIGEASGRLDILVNNAGAASGVQRLNHEQPADFDRIMQLNVTGVWLGMRGSIPLMQRAGGGSIVNIASIDSFIGVAGMTTYVATKFAVLGLTKSAALELGAYGIRVNSVHPGIIATPGVDRLPESIRSGLADAISRQPIKRFGAPGDVANAVLFFASETSSYCTGSSLVVDGGHIAGRYRELSE